MWTELMLSHEPLSIGGTLFVCRYPNGNVCVLRKRGWSGEVGTVLSCNPEDVIFPNESLFLVKTYSENADKIAAVKQLGIFEDMNASSWLDYPSNSVEVPLWKIKAGVKAIDRDYESFIMGEDGKFKKQA